MKRFLKIFVLICLAALTVYSVAEVLAPWLTAEKPEDDFAAAELLLEDVENGGDGLWFRRDTIDPDRVYRALEAQLPYAFTMHCRVMQDGSSELLVEIENRAAQAQAETLAQGIADSLALKGKTDEEKLLALHDWLVANCAYDLSLTELETLDGSAPSFTAAGALVNGKAVCMGYARAYQMLCRAVGIETFFVVSEEMNHAWNAVMLDGDLLFIDCTYDDPIPDRGDEVSHDFFLVNAVKMRETHVWDEEFYAVLGDKIYAENFF